MSTTFEVTRVSSEGGKLNSTTFKSSAQQQIGKEGEAGASNASRLIHTDPGNPFIMAANVAFGEHLPLTLSPDDVWLCIAQGFGRHVLLNAETLRKKFVQHEGQELIIVRRDHFLKGNPDNDWAGCFHEFSDKIAAYIGKSRDLIVSKFSTTGSVEKAASEVVLMSAMQRYFRYEVHTRCGIPRITLLGTPEDWVSVRERAAMLTEYDLGWWTDHLLPVLDQFITAAKGNPDAKWWQSFYKLNSGSGGPYIGGHVQKFFPYLRDWQTEKFTRKNEFAEKMFGGPTMESFPVSVSFAPFRWLYYDQQFEMEFGAGFIGVMQDESNAVRPATGWVVRERNS